MWVLTEKAFLTSFGTPSQRESAPVAMMIVRAFTLLPDIGWPDRNRFHLFQFYSWITAVTWAAQAGVALFPSLSW
jgi:hypothetical protein